MKKKVRNLVKVHRNFSTKKPIRFVFHAIWADAYVEITRCRSRHRKRSGWRGEFVSNGQVKEKHYCNMSLPFQDATKAEIYIIGSLKEMIQEAKAFLNIRHFNVEKP